MVRASLTNGSSRDRDAQVSQASRCAGASAGVVELVEQSELFFEQERAVERLLACWTSPSFASWSSVCLAGDFSSDQRVPLIHFPAGVLDRSWAFHSSRRT
jgi:hypothetical protein